MRITLIDRAEFQYVVDLEPVAAPAGLYSLKVATKWRGAKDPNAEQVKLEVLVEREGLERLKGAIEELL
jgi:hypothetical protein